MLPDGAMPIVPVQAGPRSERMSPNRFEATTTSNQSGLSTKCAVRMSMWYLSQRTSGIALRHLLDALVPIRHGDRDAVRLRGRGEVLLRRASARARRRTSAPDRRRSRVMTVSCTTISRSVPGNMRPPIGRVLAFGVLAHDPEVDVAGLAVGERRAARPGISRTGRRLTYWSNSRRNRISEPHSEMWSGTFSGQPTAPKKIASCAPMLLLPVLRHHAAVLERSSRRRRSRASPAAARSRISSPPPRARARPPAPPPCRCRRRG